MSLTSGIELMFFCICFNLQILISKLLLFCHIEVERKTFFPSSRRCWRIKSKWTKKEKKSCHALWTNTKTHTCPKECVWETSYRWLFSLMLVSFSFHDITVIKCIHWSHSLCLSCTFSTSGVFILSIGLGDVEREQEKGNK